ncbi:MAG: UTP--glucose-1-phosphate uridylyltransferase GalU [Candidatus Puniceispirillaceae bacterium]
MVKKAIFPVGGLGTRFLPATKALPKEMLPVVDKPLIQYALEEAIDAGIEDFIFVTGRNKTAIEDHFDHSVELEAVLAQKGKDEALQTVRDMMRAPGSVAYVRQQEAAGLGHAVWCARHLVKDEPVAVLLADDLVLGKPTLTDMVRHYKGGNMVAVMDVPHHQTSSYGIVTPADDDGTIVTINGLVEKPSPQDAPSNIAVIGRYIIEPEVFDVLGSQHAGVGGEIQLTDALATRIGKAPFTGYRFEGKRFDCGSKIGFQKANLAFSLERDDMADELRTWLKTQI